jgi:GNAT superfamily N-acetyltransferase
MAQVDSETQQATEPVSEKIDIAIRPFDSSMNRTAFVCSDEAMTAYFIGTGSQPRTLAHDASIGAATAHVMLDRQSGEILGFFTLSSLSIARDLLPTSALRKGQTEDVSVTLLGRMAVCSRLEGKGYGKRLLITAMVIAQQAANLVGSTALVVDPKTEELISFYEKQKFIRLKPNERRPWRLFLPMKMVAEIIAGASR